MPTPQAILAVSKRNWRRLAAFFGNLPSVVFMSAPGHPAGRSPDPLAQLPDCCFLGLSCRPLPYSISVDEYLAWIKWA
jgi:hypothetical protein